MHRSHKIRVYPNDKQATYFKKACGVSRLAYNWGLEQWSAQYKAGGRPSAFGLKKEFNVIKKEKFPFVYEVTKTAAERAFADLQTAFNRFFKKQGKYPRFKKKGVRDSFYISAQYVRIDRNRVRIPKLGWVRMAECLRFPGRVLSVTVSRAADMWFISIAVEIPDAPECSDNQVHSAVGIDLGIDKLATLSDGMIFHNPRTTKKYERRLRRLNKSLARKKKGSNNWRKAKLKLSKLHYRIRCTRQDAIHKMTAFLTNNFSDIVMEDLNTKGMLRDRRLSKSIADAGFGEVKRQLEYKAIRLHFVGRFFPSTKLCMACGQLHDMPLSKRTFECACGVGSIDRDLHAAQNILRQGLPECA